MRIDIFNLHFRTMRRDDIETVRNWRNDRQVNHYLVNKNHISKEMQAAWFATIESDPLRNFYFIIEYRHVPIGVIFWKNMDFSVRNGEPGIYIADPRIRRRPVGGLAILALTEIGFRLFRVQNLTAYTHRQLTSALHAYEKLGARHRANGDPDFFLTENSADRYFPAAKRHRDRINSRSNANGQMRVLLDERDERTGISDLLRRVQIDGSPFPNSDPILIYPKSDQKHLHLSSVESEGSL